jgi:hypothetical protein
VYTKGEFFFSKAHIITWAALLQQKRGYFFYARAQLARARSDHRRDYRHCSITLTFFFPFSSFFWGKKRWPFLHLNM